MTKKKQTANTKQTTDFEELTSLTALIEEPQKQRVASKKKSLQPQVASMKSLQPQVASMKSLQPQVDSMKEESQNLKPTPNPKIQKAQTQTKKQTKAKKKPNTKKQTNSKKSYATPKEAGETPSKVMTSIIISEDVRDWLRLKSITSKQSMSQQIEELVKKEMKKAK